jgi:hypothetical protein
MTKMVIWIMTEAVFAYIYNELWQKISNIRGNCRTVLWHLKKELVTLY